jgi:HlyD family secretion protein
MRTSLKRASGYLAFGLAIAGLVWFAWPKPVPVDLATVKRGPMDVTIDDEAKTRVRHIYTVSAPVAGKVLRIASPDEHQDTSHHIGEVVSAGETIVAVMQPSIPAFLDVRSREELKAIAAAAEAAVNLAEAEVRRLESVLELSRIDLRRDEGLARTNVIAAKELDKARFDVKSNEAALASAKAQLDVRRSEQAAATARLIDPLSGDTTASQTCCIQILAPATGRVLKIYQDSETVVPAGAPLIEIGDPLDLEVVADLLSTDAVQVQVGAPVRIDGWGGAPIKGRVKRVDPAGFLKISALGIEEQRVNTVIDFVDPPEAWSRLGHDYRVIVHVTTWSANDVLAVPISAVFRKGDEWAAYAVKGGRATTVIVETGHRNDRMVEVLAGLSEGEQVVLHPSDRIGEGVAVAERETQ